MKLGFIFRIHEITWILIKFNYGSKYGNTIVFNFVEIQINVFYIKEIKGAPKLHFKHYSFVVIILFNAGLSKSLFSPCSFRKLVFRHSEFSEFSVCVSDLMKSLRGCSYEKNYTA